MTTDYNTTAVRTSGWVYFAGALTLLLSFLNVLYGLVALTNENWIALTPDSIVVFDLAALGWTHLTIGIIQLLVGLGLMAGSGLARAVAVLGAFLNATFSIAWLSVYPVWSLVMITLDVLVIYGLLAHPDEAA